MNDDQSQHSQLIKTQKTHRDIIGSTRPFKIAREIEASSL